MRAQVLVNEIGPDGIELQEVPDPVAGPGQIVVDVKSCGVCFPDVLMSRGQYQIRPPVPFVPGMEVSGVVTAVAEGSRFAVGDWIISAGAFGGFAEKIVIPEAAPVFRMHDGLSFDEGASLGINYQTVLFALKTRAHTAPGEVVAVLGARGGIGTAAIQVAKAMGTKVIAVVHRTGVEQELRDLGADEVVQLTDGWRDEVLRLSDGGVDVVIDPVGGDVFDEALRTLAQDGRYVVVGFAAGGIPTVKLNRVLFRNISIVGAAWGAYLAGAPDLPALLNDELQELFDAGLRPPVDTVYTFDQAPQAIADLADGKVRGKAVVHIAD